MKASMTKDEVSQVVTDIRNKQCEVIDIRRMVKTRNITAMWVGDEDIHSWRALSATDYLNHHSSIGPDIFPALTAVLDLMTPLDAGMETHSKYVLSREEVLQLLEQDYGKPPAVRR